MIARDDLGRLTEIGRGMYGRVYRVDGFRLSGVADELAYKEFTTSVSEQARTTRAAVELWETLTDKDRVALGSYAAWPLALVHRGGTVCGLLMPLLPDRYFFRQRDSRTGRIERKPRELQYLISTQAQRDAAGVDVPDIDRIDRHLLLAQLSYVLGLLHRLRWVYGDLSFKNAVFALNPPRLKLVDCDGAAPLSDSSRAQSHTPFWAPPEHEADADRLQDERSDVFKLGLAVLRCLTPGTGAGTSRDPRRLAGELNAEGEDLVTRALASVPSQRPRAKDLFAYFDGALRPRVRPPVIHSVDLLTPFRLRGQDVQVAYRLAGADRVEIRAPNGQVIQLAPSTAATTFAFQAHASGPVRLYAENRFGHVDALIGHVDLYELPRFDIGRVRLPRPELPHLEPVSLTASSAVLAARPPTAVGTRVAHVPTHDVFEIVRAAAPLRSHVRRPAPSSDQIAMAGMRLPGIVLSSGADLSSLVHETVARTATRIRDETGRVTS